MVVAGFGSIFFKNRKNNCSALVRNMTNEKELEKWSISHVYRHSTRIYASGRGGVATTISVSL